VQGDGSCSIGYCLGPCSRVSCRLKGRPLRPIRHRHSETAYRAFSQGRVENRRYYEARNSQDRSLQPASGGSVAAPVRPKGRFPPKHLLGLPPHCLGSALLSEAYNPAAGPARRSHTRCRNESAPRTCAGKTGPQRQGACLADHFLSALHRASRKDDTFETENIGIRHPASGACTSQKAPKGAVLNANETRQTQKKTRSENVVRRKPRANGRRHLREGRLGPPRTGCLRP